MAQIETNFDDNHFLVVLLKSCKTESINTNFHHHILRQRSFLSGILEANLPDEEVEGMEELMEEE